jgi:CheY-like chemotaxis protein
MLERVAACGVNISRYLRECGYFVIEAVNADEAVEVLQSDHVIDLVLSDVQMPGAMDGFGLAQWVRKNREGSMSSWSALLSVQPIPPAALCESGPAMAKPYQPEALVEVIRKHLGSVKQFLSLAWAR